MTTSSIDNEELAKFSLLSEHWWDKDGPLATLHAINPTRLLFINQHLDVRGKRILDVGCGGGILTEALVQLGANVTGIDAESEAIKVAKAHAKAASLPIDYHNKAIEDFEAPPFDAITCMELLEHTPNPQLIVTHASRLLKEGGYLLASTLNRTLKAYLSAVIAAEYILGLLPKQTHDYDKFIKPSELAAMARNANLETSALRGMAYNFWNKTASLEDSVAVHYLMAFIKRRGTQNRRVNG